LDEGILGFDMQRLAHLRIGEFGLEHGGLGALDEVGVIVLGHRHAIIRVVRRRLKTATGNRASLRRSRLGPETGALRPIVLQWLLDWRIDGARGAADEEADDGGFVDIEPAPTGAVHHDRIGIGSEAGAAVYAARRHKI